MTDDRVGGAVRNYSGKSDFGRVSDDAKTGATAVINQPADAVQKAYGQAVDAVGEGTDSVKQVAIEGHDFLKKFIETNPHTATLVAIGIGIFIGYAAHQPPRRRYWWD